MLIIKNLIFYGGYLVFPLLFLCLFLIFKYKTKTIKLLSILILPCSLIFIYSRFIETKQIVIQNHSIQAGFESKFTLIADLHLGVYKKQDFLKKVVEKINQQENIDFVLIAGDLTYEPQKENLNQLFEPLSSLNAKNYAVLGNHDVEKPGPKIREELITALNNHQIIVLNNQIIEFADFSLVALGSHWNSEDDTSLLEVTNSENILVLAHNPDTLSKYPNSNSASLSLFGHTHGGQIKIPIIYNLAIPTKLKVDEGFYDNQYGKFFITSGLGEVGLPMRLLNPPTIDIIQTY